MSKERFRLNTLPSFVNGDMNRFYTKPSSFDIGG